MSISLQEIYKDGFPVVKEVSKTSTGFSTHEESVIGFNYYDADVTVGKKPKVASKIIFLSKHNKGTESAYASSRTELIKRTNEFLKVFDKGPIPEFKPPTISL